MSRVPRVSRFEDIFEQMRNQFQLKHDSASNRISFSVLGDWKRNNDGIFFRICVSPARRLPTHVLMIPLGLPSFAILAVQEEAGMLN